jgi:hypothetical protein
MRGCSIFRRSTVPYYCQPWKSEIRELAAFPNVYCKVSGLVTEADHQNWTKEDLQPYIAHVIECFGWERVVYGSDWPVSKLATEYPDWVEALEWTSTGMHRVAKAEAVPRKCSTLLSAQYINPFQLKNEQDDQQNLNDAIARIVRHWEAGIA